MRKIIFVLCLLCQAGFSSAQSPEDFVKRAQDASDSNHRVTIYSAAIKKYPSDSRFYHKRGIAYGIMEYHDKASGDFDKAIALDPSVAAYYQDRGLALHRLKRNEEAVRDFSRVIELEPGNSRAYYLRAVSYTNLKQLDKAEPDLDKAVELDPKMKDEASVRQMRGLIRSKRPLISIGTRPEPAAQASEKGPAAPATPRQSTSAVQQTAAPNKSVVPAAPPELDGTKAKALANKAKVRTSLKKYSEAAGVWTELLELQPGYYPAYAERAYALHMAGEKEKAASDFNRGFAADPGQARAYLLRGAAACADSDLGRASSDLEKAVSLDPKQKREFLYSSVIMAIRMKKACK